jgi:glycogen(starch) synthase
MKILTLSGTADLSGASRCMERVFGQLAQQGHEVHAGVPSRGSLAEALEARGIAVHVVEGLQTLRTERGWTGVSWAQLAMSAPRGLWALTRLIRLLRPEVIHTNEALVPLPSVAARLTRTPHVWHLRSVPAKWSEHLRGGYLRWVAVSSREVIAVSGFVARQIPPRYQDRISVVYEGLDPRLEEPSGSAVKIFRRRFAPGTRLVGVVGRIEWGHRGQEMLVRAASLLQPRMPEVQYLFAGRAPEEEPGHEAELHQLVETYGLQSCVTFLGNDCSPQTVLAALDVAVVPPVVPQPYSFAALDAMAHGSCVIASRSGGLPEQVEDGETGLLFTPGDFAGLADALERLLRDDGLRQKMGAAGRQRVLGEFSFEQTVRGVERALGLQATAGTLGAVNSASTAGGT